ncbi:MAG TPA: hypothetical protein VE843_18470 [Ktedonobacteraceae bacterium]|nr:hypothetical protein [Ktedonobacteraceae bacterium]
MQSKNGTADKIIRHLKGLRTHLQPDEEPLFTMPAIWDSGQEERSVPCDAVLTNKRLFGYYYVTFPRERLFMDGLNLTEIKVVTFRQKTFEPVFRELLVSDGQHKVYIRAPRRKLERLYEALQSAIQRYGSNTQAAAQSEETKPTNETSAAFGRQEIRTAFERSPLAIILLFIGGLVLEIGGVVLWTTTQSAPTGLPLIVAGFVAVITAFLVRRQR